MAALSKFPGSLVFGLDIGTRSIVGTVGYREGKQFNIVAQAVRFHDTRAMLDGQLVNWFIATRANIAPKLTILKKK